MFRNKQVQISVGNNLPVQHAHGKIWVRPVERTTEDHEGYQAINFRADRPELLAKPRNTTIRSIFEQAKLLGLELLHIELVVKGELKLYGQP